MHYTYEAKYKNKWMHFNDYNTMVVDHPSTNSALVYVMKLE